MDLNKISCKTSHSYKSLKESSLFKALPFGHTLFNSDFSGFSKWLKRDFLIVKYFYYLSKSKLLLLSKSGTCLKNHWINCMNWQQIIWDSILAWLWYDRWMEVSYSISICPLGRSLLSHKLDPQQIRILIEQLPFYIFMLFSMKISFQNFYDLFEKFMKYIFQEVFGALVIDFRQHAGAAYLY